MAEAQMQAAQVDNETKLGFADAQHAMAQERLSKIRLDSATAIEKIESADLRKTEAFLKLVLAAKEIEGIDIDQIMKVMGMQHTHDQAQKASDMQQQDMQMKQEQHAQQLAAQQQQMQQPQQSQQSQQPQQPQQQMGQ